MVVDEDGIVPNDPRPTGDAGEDRGMRSDPRLRFYSAVEHRPDDALMDEFRTDD